MARGEELIKRVNLELSRAHPLTKEALRWVGDWLRERPRGPRGQVVSVQPFYFRQC
jgi:hypothetical protein